MKKRLFVAPLAVSVAALLNGLPSPAQATLTTSILNQIENGYAAGTAEKGSPLVIDRARKPGITLIQDDNGGYSHDSHSSHDSHASHDSHSSGDY